MAISRAELLDLLAKGFDGQNSYGLKLMMNYIPRLVAIFNRAADCGEFSNASLIESLGHWFSNLFIVSLYRNGVDQCISRNLSDVSGIYHVYSSGDVVKYGDDRPGHHEVLGEIDFEYLVNINHIVQLEKVEQKRLSDSLAFPVLELNYEDLIKEPKRSSELIYAESIRAGLKPVRREFKRTTTKVVTQEVSTALRSGLINFATQNSIILFE